MLAISRDDETDSLTLGEDIHRLIIFGKIRRHGHCAGIINRIIQLVRTEALQQLAIQQDSIELHGSLRLEHKIDDVCITLTATFGANDNGSYTIAHGGKDSNLLVAIFLHCDLRRLVALKHVGIFQLLRVKARQGLTIDIDHLRERGLRLADNEQNHIFAHRAVLSRNTYHTLVALIDESCGSTGSA